MGFDGSVTVLNHQELPFTRLLLHSPLRGGMAGKAHRGGLVTRLREVHTGLSALWYM